MTNEQKMQEVERQQVSMAKKAIKNVKRMVKMIGGFIVVVSVFAHEVNQDSRVREMQEQQMQVAQKDMAMQTKMLHILNKNQVATVYTVTGNKSKDNYIETVSADGTKCYLSDVEIDLFSLKKGDKVTILTNKYGEVVSVNKAK